MRGRSARHSSSGGARILSRIEERLGRGLAGVVPERIAPQFVVAVRCAVAGPGPVIPVIGGGIGRCDERLGMGRGIPCVARVTLVGTG